VGYAYCGTGEFVSGVEDWVLGVDDGLGVENDGCTWKGGGCGVLKEVLGGYVDCRGFVGSIGVLLGYLCVSVCSQTPLYC
jgi:hypothetical protein